MRARLACIVAGMVAWPVATGATPVPVEIVERSAQYLVHGHDGNALAREMAERGPQHPTGRRAWAYTAWELRSRYALERDGRHCRLLEPTVVLDVVTTMPRWEPKGVVPMRLRATWLRMLDKAADHERVHRRHGVEAAHAAAAALAAVPASGDCALIERQVRSALRRASSDALRRSRIFDRETDYGRLGGVRLGD